MKRYKQYFPRLMVAVGLFFFILLFVVTVIFFAWLDRDLRQELELIEREIDLSIASTIELLTIRSLEQLEGRGSYAPSLLPIPFEYPPSPFSVRDLRHFQKHYPSHIYYGDLDIANQGQFLAGYAPVKLSSGRNGKHYLSVLAWFNFPPNRFYDGQGVRNQSDHMWLMYHDTAGQLIPVLISWQAPASLSDRQAEISGFMATRLGVYSGLKLEPTIKGSVYIDDSASKFKLIFRMRLKGLRSDSRPEIDLGRPIGLQYIHAGNKAVISTFLYDDGVMADTPHITGASLKQALDELPSIIRTVFFSNENEVDGQNTRLLDRAPILTSKKFGRIEQLLWKYLATKAKDMGWNVQQHKQLGFSFTLQRSVNLAYAAPLMKKLEVVVDLRSRLTTFLMTMRKFVLFYLFILLVVIVTSVFILYFVVYRITRLARSLERFQQAGGYRFRDPSIPIGPARDEIGQLAKTLHSALFRLNQRQSILSYRNTALEAARYAVDERYHRREEMMRILGHDIRTPVAALLSLLDVDQQSEARQYVRKIERASNTILEGVRIEDIFFRDGIMMKVEAYSFLKAMGKSLQLRFSGRVLLKLVPSEIFIRTDPETLEDAIDGIFANAIDFSTIITLRVYKEGKNCVMDISNNGPFIPEGMIKSIFEHGVSERDIDNDRHHGIGLFSVAMRIRALGGSVEAVNRCDEGPAFLIYIPISDSS